MDASCEEAEGNKKILLLKGMTWLKENMMIKQKWIIKAKKVPLMMIILPSEVDGEDDSGGSDKGRRCSHLFSIL